jgi:hypothetical protein
MGVDSGANLFIYERGYGKKDGKASRYLLGIYPQLKYNFSDKVNVYTSLAISLWNPRSIEDEMALHNKTLSGRLGMGMAYSRDIYFAPYLNFYPENPKADTTTISFSTIFSIL